MTTHSHCPVQGILQVRMGSSRLPGKALLPLAGKPILAHVVDRIQKSHLMDRLIIATTKEKEDDAIEAFCFASNLPVYRGSTIDVLDRFYQCTRIFPCDVVVRLTADDPLKSPKIIDLAINRIHKNPDLDYCSNTLKPTFPEGLDVEVLRTATLERCWKEASLPSEREHVTPYIWKNPDRFNLENFTHHEHLGDWRWTVDTPADMKFMDAIYDYFYDSNPNFDYEEVIAYLKKHPEIRKLNSKIERNAGYKLSLKKENRHEQQIQE